MGHPPTPAYKYVPAGLDSHSVLTTRTMLGLTVLAAVLACGKLRVGDEPQPMGCKLGLPAPGQGPEPGALLSPGLQERSLEVRCGFRYC